MRSDRESAALNARFGGVVFTIVGLWTGIRGALDGDAFAFFGLGLVVAGVGLWFRKEWARWLAIAVVIAITADMVVKRWMSGTLEVFTVIAAAILLYGAWYIWRYCGPLTRDKETEREPMVSLVLLLREPRFLEGRILAEIVSSAWGEPYSSGDGDENAARWVVGETPVFMINAPEGFFIVNNFDQQYFSDMEKLLDEIDELRARKALEDHQAWLSVDLTRLSVDGAAPETVYPRIASLIAELGGPDCLAVYHPDSGRISVWDDELAAKLRGPQAMEALGTLTQVPVIRVADDDPRMKAAAEEARARWPEFVDAFKRRDGRNFSIKAPITVDGNTEFIWIEVDGLEPEYIHGRLSNDPVNLGDMKIGDRVEVALKDLNDWAFIRNDEPFGLFTSKVLVKLRREK